MHHTFKLRLHDHQNYPSRGVTYFNRDGVKRLMKMDEVEKFSDGTLEVILTGFEKRKEVYIEERSRMSQGIEDDTYTSKEADDEEVKYEDATNHIKNRLSLRKRKVLS